MARIDPPMGYSNWNDYIETQADLSIDQSIEVRRLIKRNIKLGLIASKDRQADGDTSAVRFRPYNIYISPGTFSPDPGHPWLLSDSADLSELLLENGDYLIQENNSGFLL